MCTPTFAATSSFSFLQNRRYLFPDRHRNSLLTSPFPFLTSQNLRLPIFRFSGAISDKISGDVSWQPLDYSSVDNFGGWEVPETPIPQKTTGFPSIYVTGVGASIALLIAVIAQFSLAKKGFRLPFRRSFSESSTPLVVEVTETKATDYDVPYEVDASSESVVVELSDVINETVTLEKHKPRIITISVDPNQQEAVNLLKKLKIIDEDVKADEICSRREYARWLVRTSSLLERNPKYKITTPASLSGSVITAYEDVTIGDQDFDSIQALAEAGVVPSKLSTKCNLDEVDMKFSPERFISRRDLIDWRAQLEYDFSMTGNHEILKTKLDLLDVREISSEKWPGLLMDMLAGEKCLFRRVFGHIKRLQPDKPSTVAQAAVALTVGRMIEAINTELLRIQAEESSRQAAKEELKLELLGRGDIQRYWAKKIDEEKAYVVEVQQLYTNALKELEQEKSVLEGARNGNLKEKAAMDCQKQLLDCLKEEVNEMSEKLVSERAGQTADEEAAQTLRSDLQAKKEGILDAKSLLEAEIEALRILRSWIEDEARKSQARTKVLEAVGRRWKWDGE